MLGPFYISKNELEIIASGGSSEVDIKHFVDILKDKVLMYLYEDAARPKRSIMFNGCKDYMRYSSICKEFEAKGMEIFGINFKENYYDVVDTKS